MTKVAEKLANLLPEGLSESGMEEIGALVEGVVQERVDSEIKDLEAKVSGFLRMKIDEFKSQARKELENDDETFRAVKVYESLKAVIAEDIESKDSDSALASYKEDNTKLQEPVDSLNSKLSQLMTENSTLEESICDLRSDVTTLNEVKKAPFKSSEKALVITNESANEKSVPTSGDGNIFLTEDVLRLSQTLNS